MRSAMNGSYTANARTCDLRQALLEILVSAILWPTCSGKKEKNSKTINSTVFFQFFFYINKRVLLGNCS